MRLLSSWDELGACGACATRRERLGNSAHCLRDGPMRTIPPSCRTPVGPILFRHQAGWSTAIGSSGCSRSPGSIRNPRQTAHQWLARDRTIPGARRAKALLVLAVASWRSFLAAAARILPPCRTVLSGLAQKSFAVALAVQKNSASARWLGLLQIRDLPFQDFVLLRCPALLLSPEQNPPRNEPIRDATEQQSDRGLCSPITE
jgi:hypothetical protein